MPELESSTELWRQLGEKAVEDRQIFFQVRRQLEEHGAELVPERSGNRAERPDQIAGVLQTIVVRNTSGRLQRELIRGRRLVGPSTRQLLVGHPVEGVVDLDRRKSRGVVRQHFGRGKIGGVKAALPFTIVVARCADPNHRSGKLYPCAAVLCVASASPRSAPHARADPSSASTGFKVRCSPSHRIINRPPSTMRKSKGSWPR